MERAELLHQLKQPRLVVDLIAGSIAVLGLFGCFNESQLVKRFSLSTLMAGVGVLAANVAIANLYADAAAGALERALLQATTQRDAAQQRAEALSLKVNEWQTFWAKQSQEIDTLKVQLAQEKNALAYALEQSRQESAQAQHQAHQLEAYFTGLQHQIDTLTVQLHHERQQFYGVLSELGNNAKLTLKEVVNQWEESLDGAIAHTLRKRPDLKDRMLQIQQEVKAVAASYGQQITALTLAPNILQPSPLVDEILSLLHHAVSEFAALKVKYRNALNVGDAAHYQAQIEGYKAEVLTLQQTVERLQTETIARSQHEAILSEFQVKKDEQFSTLAQHAEMLESELTTETDQYVQKLLGQLDQAIREIAALKEQVTELRKPQNFSPATRDDLRMGNQIIEYFRLHHITLDRAGSDYKKHEATLYFHTDRNPRLILPGELNEHSDKLLQTVRCLNKPEFKFDSESGLVSVWLQLSQKPPVDPSTVLKTVGTPEDFLKYLSNHPISYRIIGDKGRGKTPLMAVMAAHFLKVGGRKGNVPNGMKMPKMLVGVSYPNADFSQKDKGRYPLEPFLFARNDEQCKKAIATIYQNYQMRRDPAMSQLVDNFFQLWVIDEADNTLDFSAEGSASKMRSIFNDGGHSNTGWIFAGQSVNTRVLRGWTNDDRKKSTEIILEAAKIKAWANEYGSDYYGEDRLKSMLANVDAIREAIEKENESICDEAKRLRLALVADPISPKLFLLPSFDTAEFDLESYAEIQMESDGILGGILDGTGSTSFQMAFSASSQIDALASDSTIPWNPEGATYTASCPDCGKVSSDRKGKPEGSKQRYFCKNSKCSKKTFTVSLHQLINSD